MSTKINRLLQQWPPGTVATSRWLQTQGVGPDLLDGYRKSGWVTSIGWGAAVRAGDTVQWPGAVQALQRQLALSVHPGGKTALILRGQGHFLPLGRERVCLFCSAGERLPMWFRKHDWGADMRVMTTRVFGTDSATGLSALSLSGIEVRVSSAERAMMEMLYCVPGSESLDEARLVMEGLVALRPEVVQALLVQCTSVAVKRLFLALAEAANHPWLAGVDTSRITLGSGKRQVVKGGYLEPKYKVTLPREWKVAEEPNA